MVDRYSEHDVEAASEGDGYAFVSVESNNNNASGELRVPTSVEFDLTTDEQRRILGFAGTVGAREEGNRAVEVSNLQHRGAVGLRCRC
jgi:hypothetical protein